MKEGFFAKMGAIATVIGVVVTVVVLVLSRGERSAGETAEDQPAESITSAEPTDEVTPPEVPVPPVDAPSGGDAGGASEAAADSAQPLRVSLGDGEQAVILGGRASLAVAFTRIGEEEFPSMRVEGDGGPKTLALLGAGGRLEFTAAGSRYVASVLRKDLAAKRVDIQVDPQP